jgi:hypothetical protein
MAQILQKDNLKTITSFSSQGKREVLARTRDVTMPEEQIRRKTIKRRFN